MNRFKAGDKVKIKDRNSRYYGYNVLITTIYEHDKGCLYHCDILDSKNKLINQTWYPESDLTPINEKKFTISIRRHKHINLKFTL